MKKWIVFAAVLLTTIACICIAANRHEKSAVGCDEIVLNDGTAIELRTNHFAAEDEDIFLANTFRCKEGDIAVIRFADGTRHQIVCKMFTIATIQDGLLCTKDMCLHDEADYLTYMIGDENMLMYVWLWDIICPLC